ncbi:MAG: RDD family protein [Acidobacteriota bacterium]|nr:RDD family protein [Acidobacteriota bacterium]
MSENEADRGPVVTGEQDEHEYETPVEPAGADGLDEEGGPGEVRAAFAQDLVEDRAAWGLSPLAKPVVRAGVWRRTAAAVLDAGVSLVAAGVVLLVSELLWLRSAGAVSAPVWVPVLVFFGGGWAHTLVGEGLCNGVTLGKRALGLRVVGGGGFPPALWRVAVRRACLDAVVLVVTALALWLTMVRQYGGLPQGTPVDMDGSDAAVFCAFFVNLAVLLALARRFDPKRRFPHDSLAELAVIIPEPAGGGAAAGSGSPGRRVAAPVGVVRPRWDKETAEVAPVRPWDARKWRPDPAAAKKAAERARARMGPVSRLIEWVVARGGGSGAGEGAKAASSAPGGGRRVGFVNRLADRLVAWSEGESVASSRGGEKDPADRGP